MVRGTISRGVNKFFIKGAISDLATLCADLLVQALQAREISIEHKQGIAKNFRVNIQTTYSPKIGEIVHWVNQQSINLYAEHLLKNIGEVIFHEGSTEAGLKAIRDFWAHQNIDLRGFNMMDGSGLSRKNLATTKQLASVLLKMKNSEFFSIFFHSLPEQNGSIRAKSGSMSLIIRIRRLCR